MDACRQDYTPVNLTRKPKIQSIHMERSPRLLASGEAPSRIDPGITPSGPDHISALPDDLLLLVLTRLRCAATAARTSVLARRWRYLWTCLPALVVRDVRLLSLPQALAARDSAPAAPDQVTLLDISVPDTPATGPCVSTLLRAAAGLSPEHLVLALPSGVENFSRHAELPCLERATSIELSVLSLFISAPADKCPFPALTTLVLSGVTMHGLAALVPRCPCLRVLRFAEARWTFGGHEHDLTVHSASLRELVIEDDYMSARRIDIATPALEQLAMSTIRGQDLTVSVLAPKAEKVSWRCSYGAFPRGFGVWSLEALSLTAAPSAIERPLLRVDARKDRLAFPTDDRLAWEVEQHLQMQLAVDLSVLDLELGLTTLGHVYGAFVSYLLGINQIGSATRRLKVAVMEPEKFPYMGAECCYDNCLCQPTDWMSQASQAISLMTLEEVEVDGFKGYEHEFEFLELVFRCAPILKRVTVKQSRVEDDPSDKEIYDMFKAHPSVECYLDPL